MCTKSSKISNPSCIFDIIFVAWLIIFIVEELLYNRFAWACCTASIIYKHTGIIELNNKPSIKPRIRFLDMTSIWSQQNSSTSATAYFYKKTYEPELAFELRYRDIEQYAAI